jgi:hemoglobin-like flavoprotein
MTPEKIALVKESWAAVAPISNVAADLFYTKLFELDPSLKSLFPEDMKEQKKKLMQTIAYCVHGLNDLGEIVPAVQALGKRHKDYHVKASQYPTVGSALIWTLQQGLGEKFTPELKDAWIEVYGILSSTMIQASENN